MSENFLCLICKNQNELDFDNLHREIPSCDHCKSTVRLRQLSAALDTVLSKDFAHKKNVNVVGLSDHDLVKRFLDSYPKITYTNTFFDEEPNLDICRPGKKWKQSADILISSDVLEHVFYPISHALEGSLKVLKPNGVLVLTMPWNEFGASIEHYPWMTAYSVIEEGPDIHKVIGVDQQGLTHIVQEPNFHGGPGNTLEMRLISLHVLLHELSKVGFRDIEVQLEENRTYGINPTLGMGVILARKPKHRWFNKSN